ncbi:isoprenoid biosynthesis glyoxalase ElbB [Vibrio aphrogenes]|uniref:isoprenoid biosynthesis glyoxalase ElbB n=1 Tax=Vibrio aphrogenes TaxID=1891186 RepID=UPI000B35A43C|nr:isoprenoid biosynthesis glyoxalase ElbB [Vibrio aphrogenes]
MSKQVAVILAGCGVFDGSEINEVVLTLLALEEQSVGYQCFAPNIEQAHVLDHLTGEEQSGSRNVLQEAARIVRGKVKDIAELDVSQYDGLIMTGGFGVAKNLSSLAFKGAEFDVLPCVAKTMKAFYAAGKIAGYMCIAPVLLPKVFEGVKCTIGHDPETAAVITSLGGKHVECQVNEITIDEHYKVVTTPAYMLADNLIQAKSGIDKLVASVCKAL